MDRVKKNFETARTKKHRATPLTRIDENTISNIEEHGCSIVSVQPLPCQNGMGWSYSIGVYDTSGQPELITVGLSPDAAHSALNEAAKLLRSGIDLTKGRHRDLVGSVDCEFRPVDPKWVTHLMNWANWYYDGASFPVLQAVYPDLENRFPEDPDFDRVFDQPLMQLGAPMKKVENEFWAWVQDSGSDRPDWRFPDSPHTSVFQSETVDIGIEPVVFVSHDADDGSWQFLGDSMTDGGGPVVTCLHIPIDKDPSLAELAELPRGWYAERASVGEPWIRHKRLPDD